MNQSTLLHYASKSVRMSAIVTLIVLSALATPLASSAQTFMFNRTDFPTGIGPETLAVGDFRGNGRMDVVVGNTLSTANTVSVLLGNGNGTFAAHVDYAAGGAPTSVAVGDFNGDGKLDIAVLYGSSNAVVSVLLGKGDGTFRPFITTTAGPGGDSIAVGDFNGDGKLDIAISDNLELTEGVDILLGNGNGTFQAPVTYATANDPRMVVVADFNGDGKLDLATINSGSQTVSLLLGTGTGMFGSHADFATKQPGCVSLAAGDLRNNGKVDVVAGCLELGEVVVLLGSGTGSFATAKAYAVPDGAEIVTLGDFTGNGKLDVAVTNGQSTGVVSVLAGSGSGTLKAAVPFATNFGPIGVGAADFNGDGKLDLVTADSGSPFGAAIGDISVLLSNGTSLFAKRTDYSVSSASTTGAYSGIAAAVLSGTKPDLIIPVTFANQLAVLVNKGSGTFDPFVTYPLPTNPQAVVTGDFNNDKKIDVAVVNFGGTGSISVLLNSGTGTLGAYTQYNTNGYGYGIATGDFNKDGNLDIVVTDLNNDTVSVLLGNGTGVFPSFATYATGSSPYGVTVGDFNGDGFVDLAVANEGAGTVSILLNKADGSGTFLPKVDYTVGGNPLTIAVGSFRNNDIFDLAVATDQAFGGIAILLGNGDGTFASAVTHNTLNNAYSVVAGDFNNDGNLDLAFTIVNPGNPGFVTLMPGHGDGTFGNGVTLTTGTLPYGIVAADFNADGGLDLATNNGTASDVGSATVLLNEPVVGLTPSSLTFAAQAESTKSPAQVVTLSNPGATPLKITSITIAGPDAIDFSETNTCPKTLDTGKSCTIDVIFAPAATGSLTGNLNIKDSALSSAQVIALSGSGTP
jgi:FG-GAP-like repeat/FG-GAP repeat